MEEKPEKKYIFELNREEVEEEIVDLQEHPHFKLALQVIDGQKKLDKYNKLVGLLKPEEKKPEK